MANSYNRNQRIGRSIAPESGRLEFESWYPEQQQAYLQSDQMLRDAGITAQNAYNYARKAALRGEVVQNDWLQHQIDLQRARGENFRAMNQQRLMDQAELARYRNSYTVPYLTRDRVANMRRGMPTPLAAIASVGTGVALAELDNYLSKRGTYEGILQDIEDEKEYNNAVQAYLNYNGAY